MLLFNLFIITILENDVNHIESTNINFKEKQIKTKIMLYILLILYQTVISASMNQPEKPKSVLDPAKMYFLNWSTCDEFLNNTSFNISKIIDIDWKIFYYWNHDLEDSYIVRFSVPSQMVIALFFCHAWPNTFKDSSIHTHKRIFMKYIIYVLL